MASAIPYVDVARLVLDAGFRAGPEAAVAVALIAAESGRVPDAVYVNGAGSTAPGSRDRGLWQINSHWHPDVSDAEAFDPVISTKYALGMVRASGGFTPWAAFTKGAHLKFLPEARVALDAVSRIKRLEAQLAALQSQMDAARAAIG